MQVDPLTGRRIEAGTPSAIGSTNTIGSQTRVAAGTRRGRSGKPKKHQKAESTWLLIFIALVQMFWGGICFFSSWMLRMVASHSDQFFSEMSRQSEHQTAEHLEMIHEMGNVAATAAGWGSQILLGFGIGYIVFGLGLFFLKKWAAWLLIALNAASIVLGLLAGGAGYVSHRLRPLELCDLEYLFGAVEI